MLIISAPPPQSSARALALSLFFGLFGRIVKPKIRQKQSSAQVYAGLILLSDMLDNADGHYIDSVSEVVKETAIRDKDKENLIVSVSIIFKVLALQTGLCLNKAGSGLLLSPYITILNQFIDNIRSILWDSHTIRAVFDCYMRYIEKNFRILIRYSAFESCLDGLKICIEWAIEAESKFHGGGLSGRFFSPLSDFSFRRELNRWRAEKCLRESKLRKIDELDKLFSDAINKYTSQVFP